jgi:phytanoyl-CoA hydroxylase
MLLPGAVDLDLGEPLAAYARDGYAPLGRLITDEALAALRARSDDIMLGRVTYPGLFFQHDTVTGRYDDLTFGKGWEGPSLNYRKIEKLEKDPLFWSLIENPLFARIARAALPEAPSVTLYRAVLFNKAARGGTVLPWHQDGGRFWGIDRDPVLQIWVALDDAPIAAGCVEMVPGTHHAGFATPLGGLVPAELSEAHGAEARAVPVPARAGEAMLIHNAVWHRSGVNHTDAPRRAFTACYMDGRTRCLRKKRAPREFVRVF